MCCVSVSTDTLSITGQTNKASETLWPASTLKWSLLRTGTRHSDFASKSGQEGREMGERGREVVCNCSERRECKWKKCVCVQQANGQMPAELRTKSKHHLPSLPKSVDKCTAQHIALKAKSLKDLQDFFNDSQKRLLLSPITSSSSLRSYNTHSAM